MLTSIALCLAPFLQSGAALHPAEATLFFELPDVQALAHAWTESAIPSILEDEALVEALTLAGAPDLTDFAALEAQLPAQLRRDLMPILHALGSVSLSAQIDLATLESIVTETVVFYQVSQEIDALRWAVVFSTDAEGNYPASLQAIDLSPEQRLDPFGNPYVYTPQGETFSVTCLGADGAPGGAGLNADWNSDGQFAPFLVSQVGRIAGLQLVVEWNEPETAGRVAGMAGMFLGRLLDEIPFAKTQQLGTDPEYTSLAIVVDPEAVGVGGDAAPIEFAFHSNSERCILSLGRMRGAEVVARESAWRAGAADAKSLANDTGYRESMARVASDEGAVLWQGLVRGLTGPEVAATPPPVVKGPGSSSVQEILSAVGALFRFVDFGGGAWQTRLVDGRYVSDSFSVSAQGLGNLSAAAAMIPNDAVWFELFKITPVGAWEFLEGLTSPDDARELARVEEQLGVDIRAELLDNLGNEFALWFPPVAGLAPPSVFATVPVRDGAAVMQALDAMADMLVQVQPEFSVSHRPYKGVDYTTLDVGIPIGFRPTFAVIDGMLWMSNSSTLLKRRIREFSKGEFGERGAHPALAGARQADGSLSPTLESASYFDVGSILAAYYGAGRSFAGMIPADAGVPPGLVGALPDADIFTRHIAPSVSTTVFREGLLVTHKEGAFGPEPLMLVAAAALVVPRAFEAMMEPPPATEFEFVFDEEPTAAQHLLTQHILATLEVGLLVYSIENADFPESLEQLLEATDSYPKGYLELEALPTDEWDHPLHYRRISADEYVLYSAGPDGIDQAGEGDDVRGN